MNLFRKKIFSSTAQLKLDGSLVRTLRLKDLTALGIAAIVGAGIYGTIGNASAMGGPAVSLLFVFTAVACLFSALCYADFASSSPVSGSAYSYAYIAFGELIAWIIGWDLVMEYAIGNIAVAISWSDYFTSFCAGLNLHIPFYLTMDYFSAYQSSVDAVTPNIQASEAALAWATAPVFGGIKVIFDLPALLINILITAVVYIGINESKKLANALVVIKLIVIVMIIIIGFYYVNPQNWIPFAPNGFSGVFQGVSAVFFAYIGFDAISTTSEECINPQKDLPKSMIYALAICTILYVLITLVLTGMVSYTELNLGDPLSYVFSAHGLNFLSGVIALSAIVSLASVLLVFQIGQPRIWMSMSRDGLLPSIFAQLSKRFKTPWFSTLLTGAVVAVPTMFMNLTQVTDLCSIGTLFAFLLVCAGVLVKKPSTNPDAFKITYVNSRWIAPAVTISIFSFYFYYDSEIWVWNVEHLPIYIFLLVIIGMSIWAFVKQLSLIPVMGVFINLYLMSQLGLTNWLRFGLWLLIGLVIYFSYGIRKSKLNGVEG